MSTLDMGRMIAQIQQTRQDTVVTFFDEARRLVVDRDPRLSDLIKDIGADLIATAGAALLLTALDRLTAMHEPVQLQPEAVSNDVDVKRQQMEASVQNALKTMQVGFK